MNRRNRRAYPRQQLDWSSVKEWLVRNDKEFSGLLANRIVGLSIGFFSIINIVANILGYRII